MTLTTEQLRARAESLGLDFFIERRAGIWVKEWLNDGCTSATAEEVMMWSMLANREAQPVAWIVEGDGAPKHLTPDREYAYMYPERTIMPLYTAPPAPAPAVPDGLKRAVTFYEQVKRENTPVETGVWKDAVNWVLEEACRAAMLAQPVSSGYKLPDNVREALTLALQAMEFMGDTLNNIDAVCTEDVEYVTPAFNAVRELLAAAPEGGNG
nr:hypothetical protein [Serratia marcescens]